MTCAEYVLQTQEKRAPHRVALAMHILSLQESLEASNVAEAPNHKYELCIVVFENTIYG
jgi:hypothetical protein